MSFSGALPGAKSVLNTQRLVDRREYAKRLASATGNLANFTNLASNRFGAQQGGLRATSGNYICNFVDNSNPVKRLFDVTVESADGKSEKTLNLACADSDKETETFTFKTPGGLAFQKKAGPDVSRTSKPGPDTQDKPNPSKKIDRSWNGTKLVSKKIEFYPYQSNEKVRIDLKIHLVSHTFSAKVDLEKQFSFHLQLEFDSEMLTSMAEAAVRFRCDFFCILPIPRILVRREIARSLFAQNAISVNQLARFPPKTVGLFEASTFCCAPIMPSTDHRAGALGGRRGQGLLLRGKIV